MFTFEEHQRAILEPSSSDSLATLEKKFGKTFSWVCMGFSKKKKSNFDQNRINFTKILVILTTQKKFSVFKQKLNITTSIIVPHFKDKSLQFLVFNSIPSKNSFWLMIYGNI